MTAVSVNYTLSLVPGSSPSLASRPSSLFIHICNFEFVGKKGDKEGTLTYVCSAIKCDSVEVFGHSLELRLVDVFPSHSASTLDLGPDPP